MITVTSTTLQRLAFEVRSSGVCVQQRSRAAEVEMKRGKVDRDTAAWLMVRHAELFPERWERGGAAASLHIRVFQDAPPVQDSSANRVFA